MCGLLGSMMDTNKEDKMRINVMGQVLSCPQFIFRITPPTDGETEPREVRPPAAMAGTPSQRDPGQSRFLRTPGTPVSKTPWNGAGLGDSGWRRENKEDRLAAAAEGLTPGLVRGARSRPLAS